MPDFVEIGYIEKAHGVKGEVRVRAATDHPQRFTQLKKIFVESPQGIRTEFKIVKASVRGHTIFLGLKGVASRDEALSLKGSTIKIRREDCLPLAEDEFYHFEVIGSTVKTTDGRSLGFVVDVWEVPANSIYVVKKGNREVLIPAIKQVVKKVDVDKGEIIIDPMEGLLDQD
ncbi:MAG: ribosome maturation factor RimM [bacterium]